MRKIIAIVLVALSFTAFTGCKNDCCKDGHCVPKK